MTKQRYIIEQQIANLQGMGSGVLNGTWMPCSKDLQGLNEAINYFRQLCLDNSDTAFRLTAHAAH